MHSNEIKSSATLQENIIIRLLLESTAGVTGSDFFKALVKSLTEVLGTTAAWVTEYDLLSQRLRALAMYADGRFVDHYEYDISQTPCEPVISNCSVAHFRDRVVDLFPEDPDLPQLGAVSYIGAPFINPEGEVLGHVAALDRKPMPETGNLSNIIQLFAVRAGAEYQRIKAIDALMRSEEMTSRLLESAMDGILILDDEFTIERFNPAADKLFSHSMKNLRGENLLEMLSPRCIDKINTIKDMVLRENRACWIPEGLEIAGPSDESIPTESTLSLFRSGSGTYFTLILRNILDRKKSQERIAELTRETELLRSALEIAAGEDGLIGDSECMRKLRISIRQVSETGSTVLIQGETGVGKELVARLIHRQSQRKNRPLVCVNCAAIPESLMESEFFGHEKGAFTGATERRIGRFERADGGTLFLDEIGELPMPLQAKLLRVLQDGEIERVGGTSTIKVDVRVIAATHRDLGSMVKEGKFRQDLYYRLDVFPIRVPPLRERKRDITALVHFFVDRLSQRMGRHYDPVSDDDLSTLFSYDWPGNVRELQNVIERSMIQSPGRFLSISGAMPRGVHTEPPTKPSEGIAPSRTILTEQQVREFEKANMVRALEASDWVVFGADGAAARLGIKPTTLSSRMNKLGIKRPG